MKEKQPIVDLLADIDTAAHEYKRAANEHQEVLDQINNIQAVKAPEVVYTEAQFTAWKNASEQKDFREAALVRLAREKYEILNAAAARLRDAMPQAYIYYRISGGYVKEASRGEIIFVSDAQLLDQLLKGG